MMRVLLALFVCVALPVVAGTGPSGAWVPGAAGTSRAVTYQNLQAMDAENPIAFFHTIITADDEADYHIINNYMAERIHVGFPSADYHYFYGLNAWRAGDKNLAGAMVLASFLVTQLDIMRCANPATGWQFLKQRQDRAQSILDYVRGATKENKEKMVAAALKVENSLAERKPALWLCRVPEKAPAPEKSPAQAPKTTDKTDKTTEAPSPFDFGGDFAPLVGYTQETIDQKKLGERYTARFAGMTIAQADWQPQRFLQRQMFQDDVLSGKYPKTDLGQLINIFDVE